MKSANRPSPILTAFALLVLSALAVIVAMFTVTAPMTAQHYSTTDWFPEFEPTHVQLGLIAMVFGICVEALIIVTGVLVFYIQINRIFRPSALRLVDVLVVAALIATFMPLLASFFVPGPPQLWTLLIVSFIVGIVIALVLVVLRFLLCRAVAMHVELDEVV